VFAVRPVLPKQARLCILHRVGASNPIRSGGKSSARNKKGGKENVYEAIKRICKFDFECSRDRLGCRHHADQIYRPAVSSGSTTTSEVPVFNGCVLMDNLTPSSAKTHRPSHLSRPARSCLQKASQKKGQIMRETFIESLLKQSSRRSVRPEL